MDNETLVLQDFSIPRKQSAAGIVVMFLNTLQKVVRAIALPILFVAIKGRDSSHMPVFMTAVVAGSVLLIGLLAVFAYIRYQKFSFFLDEEKQEFVINEGVFNKSTLSIQLSKIQQVNINQSLLQQIIGVYSLEIDTAGSEKKEVSIKAIDQLTAVELKQRLLSKTSVHEISSPDNEAAEQHTSPFLSLSIPTLLKVGITTNYGASFLLLGGFIIGLIQFFKDYNSAFEIESNQVEQLLNRGVTFFSVCILILSGLALVLLTNIVRTMLRYFNFQIIRQNNALAISSGLFTRKNVLLKPNKVQLSAWSQNYFQQKFDLINVKIKQASYDTADKEEYKKTDIEIPGCDVTELNQILKMVYQQVPSTGIPLIPNYRFIFLQVMLKIILPIMVFLGIGLSLHPPVRQYLILALPYAILVGIMLYFEFKRHRLYVNNNFIIKRSGIWDVEHEIIEAHKIQAITAKQYFWHKKADVGHLMLHTAAGVIHFKYGNYTKINRMVNYWTYKIESSKKSWG